MYTDQQIAEYWEGMGINRNDPMLDGKHISMVTTYLLRELVNESDFNAEIVKELRRGTRQYVIACMQVDGVEEQTIEERILDGETDEQLREDIASRHRDLIAEAAWPFRTYEHME